MAANDRKELKHRVCAYTLGLHEAPESTLLDHPYRLNGGLAQQNASQAPKALCPMLKSGLSSSQGTVHEQHRIQALLRALAASLLPQAASATPERAPSSTPCGCRPGSSAKVCRRALRPGLVLQIATGW